MAGSLLESRQALLATNPIAAAGALVGLGGIAFRQAINFMNQKQRYMVVMAQNLYFHAMADNAARFNISLYQRRGHGVEKRQRHRRERRDLAGAPGMHVDRLQQRRALFRRKLVRDRPARRAAPSHSP